MSILVVLLSLAAGAYALAVIERWAVHGHLSLTGPAWAALALMGQESLLARKSDWLFFELGPVLLLVAGLMAVAVIPLAPELIITDLATGALFLNAALAYVLVALIMAGWGPNGAYAMIAGWRFLGQFIAYAMLIVMPITAVAMRAESLSTVEIVASQAQLWNVLYQPMGFVLFVVAAMGLAWLPPLDLPDATGELAAWGRGRIYRRAAGGAAAGADGHYPGAGGGDGDLLFGRLAGPVAARLGLERDQDPGRGCGYAECRTLHAAHPRGALSGAELEARDLAGAGQCLCRGRDRPGGADMTVQMIFLAFFGGAAMWFGVVVFRTHSMVRSALALLFSQTAIGAMFLVMQAEFLGVLQIMMMATEMSVMAIFMVMFMMDPGGLGKMDMTHQKRLSLWAGGIGLLAALLLVWLPDWGPVALSVPGAHEQAADLGRELLGRSMFIFQSAGLTILTAMIAATMVAIVPNAEQRK